MVHHLFGNVLTGYGTAANNRGENEGNVTTLQKLLWRGEVHSTVSAEAIRWALRYYWQTSGNDFEVNRQWNDDENVLFFVMCHNLAQISTQALHFCADQGIGVHFISGGGRYLGSFDTRQGGVQRRIRQYAALSNSNTCLELARKLVTCRGQGQRKFLMRGTRGLPKVSQKLQHAISQMKVLLKQVPQAKSLESLLGLEGNLAALYFGGLPFLISPEIPSEMHFGDRNRRPPKDRFNALLSFGYALLLKDVMNAILTVGLEPALGFYHQPRSQASPLALDLMEVFR